MSAFISALEAKLSEKNAKVAQLEESLHSQESLASQLKQRLSEKTVSFVELEESLQTREDTSSQLQQQLSEESAKVAMLEEDLQMKDSITARLQQRVAEQAVKIAEIEESLQRKESLVSRLQKAVAMKETEICEKDAEIALLKRKLKNTPSAGAQEPSHAGSTFWLVPRGDVYLQSTLLGSGAWGFVQKGVFRGQEVAVKCLHETLLSRYTIDQIQREISLMAQVRHPNLVLFIAAVVDKEGAPMIVTELLDESLRVALLKKLISGSRLPILRDVAAALNYLHCHQSPIVHRDVSSANVLLQLVGEGKYRAKLTDFGSANLVSHATTPAPGAPVYTAPEALTEVRKAQSSSIDVYSFGVLMTEVLTGTFPDPAELQSMLQQVQLDAPKAHHLVLRCINKNAHARPKMSVVLQTLTEMIGHK